MLFLGGSIKCLFAACMAYFLFLPFSKEMFYHKCIRQVGKVHSLLPSGKKEELGWMCVTCMYMYMYVL